MIDFERRMCKILEKGEWFWILEYGVELYVLVEELVFFLGFYLGIFLKYGEYDIFYLYFWWW